MTTVYENVLLLDVPVMKHESAKYLLGSFPEDGGLLHCTALTEMLWNSPSPLHSVSNID